MTKFQKQVEVRSTKKLESIKGVQALELDEMKEIQGGSFWGWLWNNVRPWRRAKREPLTGELQYYEVGIGIRITF